MGAILYNGCYIGDRPIWHQAHSPEASVLKIKTAILNWLALFLSLILVFVLWFNGSGRIIESQLKLMIAKPRPSVKAIDRATYLAYVPKNLLKNKKYPLVFALSPDANANGMIGFWQPIADDHQLIVAASTEFRNGVSYSILDPRVWKELEEVKRLFPVDRTKVIFTGISGGAMGSHLFAQEHPNEVQAIIVNTGMMEETCMTKDYPDGKVAAFLASPTDFRYKEMKRDRAFLQMHHWKTKWIEFTGGHTMAPREVYEEALGWVQATW